ncbi:MAG TPA: hypothetical protein VMW08_19145 [Acidimicrobiales bacterium]|nr:hypothetical protein [Acidimicrobiales bacterium]
MADDTGERTRRQGRARALIAIAVIGFALAAAPAVFQMFSRAPAGGDMIDDFDRYMTVAEIEQFRGYLDLIDAADAEVTDSVVPALLETGAVEDGTTFGSIESLHTQWPDIDADMTDLLDTMNSNLGNFDSVASLPPFALFPWFFFLPGLIVGIAALVTLAMVRRGRSGRAGALLLVVLGVAIVLAPAVFQMFTRAPDGAAMIDDFRPMMTEERVGRVQGYFITMGAAEGEIRNKVAPLVADEDLQVTVTATEQFSDEWPTIVGNFAPMVATMGDNIDNFEGIDALPTFSLFPWFFVIPGLLITALAVFASRSPDLPISQPKGNNHDLTQ